MEIRRYVTAVLEQGSTVSCPLKIEIVWGRSVEVLFYDSSAK